MVCGSSPLTVTFVLTVPSWLLLGQLSLLSRATVHKGVEVGSPTRPGGRWTIRSLTLSSALAGELKLMLMLKLLLAPEVGLVGAAVPLTENAAWALGAAARQASVTAAPAIHALAVE
jgi:hypothetical protein